MFQFYFRIENYLYSLFYSRVDKVLTSAHQTTISKNENEANKAKHERDRARIDKLEEDNATLRTKIDLQARSMRDNLLFFNIPEREQENTTE